MFVNKLGVCVLLVLLYCDVIAMTLYILSINRLSSGDLVGSNPTGAKTANVARRCLLYGP